MAANEAEVELVVDVSRALPQLERNLTRIISRAEDDADAINLTATVDTRNTLSRLDRELTGIIHNAESSLDSIQVNAAIEQRDAIRTLSRQLNNVVRATESGGGVDPVDVQAVIDAPRSLRQMHRSLNTLVRELEATTPDLELEVNVDHNRLLQVSSALLSVSQSAGRASVSLGRFTAVGLAGAAGLAGTVKLVGSFASALTQVAPAAAVGATGLLAIQGAALTTKIALFGVEDAIDAVFDPKTKPADLEKALKQLAPEAKKFVVELKNMRGRLDDIRRSVQGKFFAGFDDGLKTLSKSVLPVAQKGAEGFATELNKMARSAAKAADILARRGILGNAIEGAQKGLSNLTEVPGRLVNSFGLLAAAAAPAFNRITQLINQVSKDFAEKLQGKFESGALTRAIDRAVEQLLQFLRVARNFAAGFQNIFQGLNQSGEGLSAVLLKVSQAFKELTASEAFQRILKSLVSLAGTLVDVLLPLLEEALKQLAPVFEELAPIAEEFFKAIGPDLQEVIKQLGPVLLDLAKLMREQLPTAIKLVSSALKLLALALEGVHFLMENVILPAAHAVSEVFNGELAQSAQNLQRTIVSVVTIGVGEFNRLRSSVAIALGQGLQSVINFGSQLITVLTRSAQVAVSSVRTAFQNLPSILAQGLSGAVGVARQIGINIVRGLVNGLLSQVGSLISTARSIADSITNTISGALDIHSPSRATRLLGKFAGEGFALGMEDMLPRVQQAVLKVVAPVTGAGTERQLLPSAAATSPNVNVFIGSERLDARIDVRVNQGLTTRDRVLTQGVRRLV